MIAKIFLWIVIIGAIGFGGNELLQKNAEKRATEEEAQDTQTAQSDTKGDTGKKMSFAAFINSDKGSYRCEVDQYLSDMDSNGVVYLDDGNIRGDFTTVAEGRNMNTSFLIKDGYQYLWMSGTTRGVKMPVQTGATGSAQADAAGTYSWDAEQIGEYDCDPWTADTATFTTPSGTIFTDIGTMMKVQ